jgi:hypothetical protein
MDAHGQGLVPVPAFPVPLRPGPLAAQAGFAPATSTGELVGVMALLALAGGIPALLIAKLAGLAWTGAGAWGAAGSAAAMILGYPGWAKAAPEPQPLPVPPSVQAPTCPDGSPAPGDDITKCPKPKMGTGPTSPPGGWQYDGTATADFIPAAMALGVLDPCACTSEAAVRRFQAAAGLWQHDPQTGTAQTDGRYGHDGHEALGYALTDAGTQGLQAPTTVPADCTASGSRPSWWGPVGTYTNKGC